MTETRYSKDHEWARIENDIAVCGISHYAQEALGDVVYVELPDVGRTVTQGEQIAVVESSKTASEVYAPMAGEITAVNDTLSKPAIVNEDPTGGGWFFKIKFTDRAQFDALMDEKTYKDYTHGLHG
jgi:glycine cleavage system H protein